MAPLFLTAACSTFPAAQMRLPGNLAAEAERQPFMEMSGWRSGTFAVGEYRGSYRRQLDRLSIAGLFKSTEGQADFEIEGPGISSTIEAECDVRERALTLGDTEFKPGRMALRCDFYAEGKPIPARFELQESRKFGADILTRNARRGEIGLAGQIVQFRSVHEVEGGALPVEDPIGYVFEQDGRAIGALELNGRPVLILPHGTDLDRRRAMTVAATALATFWDPAVVE